MGISALLSSAILALATHAPAGPATADLASERAEAMGVLITSLEGLADWCTENKLFLERDHVFEQILEFEPDHFRAHKGLGHSRQRDGTWVVPEDRKESKNYNLGMLEKLPEQRSAAVAPFRKRMLGILQKYGSELGGAGRDEIYDLILRVDPEDGEIRALRGEVQVEGQWVLHETVTARERRLELKKLVRDSLDAVPAPEKLLPSESDAALGVAWRTLVRTPEVRVVSSGDYTEAAVVLQACHAAGSVFRALFGKEVRPPEGYTVYLLANEGEERTFLDAYPGLDPESKAFYLTLEGVGLPGSHCVQWSKDPKHRVDGAVRHTLTQLMSLAFGVDTSFAWMLEGIGLYLTRELVGTRLTWYVGDDANPDEFKKNLRAKLTASDTNWMNEAYEMLRGERRPDLAVTLKRDLNTLTLEDMLYAYVLAAYLIEARPAEAPKLFASIGSGAEPETVFQAILGMSLPQTAERVTRWLGERR